MVRPFRAVRQAKLGIGGRHDVVEDGMKETYFGTQRVEVPSGKAVSRHPEASLVWCTVTCIAKRRQRVCRLCH